MIRTAVRRRSRPTPSRWRRLARPAIGAGFGLVLVAGVVVARTTLSQATGAPSVAAELPAPPATTTRVSVGDDERQANGGSGGAQNLINAPNNNQAISADGRWVAFASTATNLVPGTRTPFGGIFLRNRETGTTSAIPWIGGGVFPDNVTAAEPSISADGGVVAFTAIVQGIQIPGAVFATKGALPFVLAWDAQSGQTVVASLAPNDQPTPGYQPSVSGDGRYIAYTQWFIPTPDTTPPSVSNLRITAPGPSQPDGFHYFYGGPPCTPPQATFQVTVLEEESGVASVTLFFQPSGGQVDSIPMSAIGSNAWEATLTNPGGWNAGPVAYWVQARDGVGNVSGSVFSNDVLYNGECFL